MKRVYTSESPQMSSGLEKRVTRRRQEEKSFPFSSKESKSFPILLGQPNQSLPLFWICSYRSAEFGNHLLTKPFDIINILVMQFD